VSAGGGDTATAPATAPAATKIAARRAKVGFTLLLALLMVSGALKQVTGNTIDPDLFWHLGTAKQILRDGVGPLVDDRAFTSYRTQWIPYSWLGDLILEGVWRAGGLRASVALGAANIAAIVALIAYASLEARRAARREAEDDDGNALLPVLLAAGVGMLLSLQYLAVRPVALAFLLIAACVALLLRDRRLGEQTGAAWLVVPLVAVGINLHFFPAVIAAFIGCFFLGSVVELRRNADPDARGELRRRARRYLLLGAATALACAATPMLRWMPAAILYLTRDDRMVRSGLIMEFWPFYRGPLGIVCAAMVAGVWGCALAWRRHVRPGEVLCAALATLLILRYGRFLPLFAFVGAPLLAAALPSIPGRILQSRVAWACVAAALAVGVCRVAGGLPSGRDADTVWLNRLPGAKGYPCEAMDYVLAHVPPRSRRLINEFGWGGYIAWRSAGRFQVLVDGRTQLFPPAVWEATYLSPGAPSPGFLRVSDADAAIVSRTGDGARFGKALRELGWTVAYEDRRSRVLLPPEAPPN
jgi:hypothetical protein